MASPARASLDHLVIAVSDWERSNSFYRDVLGAERIELTRGRRAYRLANTQLNVRGPGVSVYFRDPDGSLLEFISYE